MTDSNKVVLITGASQGIGAALVQAYRARGCLVVASSRSIKPSDDDGVLAVAGDIGDRDDAARIVARGIARFGRLDTLVNDAGIFMAKPFDRFTADDCDAMIATNLRGFFNMTQLSIVEMLERGGGHVVSVTASLVAKADSNVPSVLTSMTKGGIDAATRSLAIEYAKRGIRVNAVAPGVIQTPMHTPEAHAALAGLHPMGRMGEVRDIVDAVLYLDNAPFVTGETLRVDGGQSAGH